MDLCDMKAIADHTGCYRVMLPGGQDINVLNNNTRNKGLYKKTTFQCFVDPRQILGTFTESVVVAVTKDGDNVFIKHLNPLEFNFNNSNTMLFCNHERETDRCLIYEQRKVCPCPYECPVINTPLPREVCAMRILQGKKLPVPIVPFRALHVENISELRCKTLVLRYPAALAEKMEQVAIVLKDELSELFLSDTNAIFIKPNGEQFLAKSGEDLLSAFFTEEEIELIRFYYLPDDKHTRYCAAILQRHLQKNVVHNDVHKLQTTFDSRHRTRSKTDLPDLTELQLRNRHWYIVLGTGSHLIDILVMSERFPKHTKDLRLQAFIASRIAKSLHNMMYNETGSYLLHCDIKMENILVDMQQLKATLKNRSDESKECVFLIDFGATVMFDNLDSLMKYVPREFLGTPDVYPNISEKSPIVFADFFAFTVFCLHLFGPLHAFANEQMEVMYKSDNYNEFLKHFGKLQGIARGHDHGGSVVDHCAGCLFSRQLSIEPEKRLSFVRFMKYLETTWATKK